jgi:hypothetical protein
MRATGKASEVPRAANHNGTHDDVAAGSSKALNKHNGVYDDSAHIGMA